MTTTTLKNARNKATANKVADIKTRALAFDQNKVDAMCAEIDAAIAKRDKHEKERKSYDNKGYQTARKNINSAKIAIARLLLACNASADNMICRIVNSGNMTNVYALDKIVQIAKFVCGETRALQDVTKAFLACAILATRNGHAIIENKTNQNFLNGSDLRDFFGKDSSFADWLNDFKKDHVERDRANVSTSVSTQSSQCRNVLDVLGIGEITKPSRKSIAVNGDHAFCDYFVATFMSAE